MELLLLKDVRKLGHVGDVVNVKVGYARNYLLPQRIATEPTEENIKAIEDEKRRATAERARRTKEYSETAERMKDATVTIEAAANPEGTLYGSVGAKDIAAALQAQGFAVLADHVVVDPPIRALDNRVVTVEFSDEISVPVKVWVVREGAAGGDEGEQQAEEPAGGDEDAE
jgi:large subunit ribosomal protein L9